MAFSFHLIYTIFWHFWNIFIKRHYHQKLLGIMYPLCQQWQNNLAWIIRICLTRPYIGILGAYRSIPPFALPLGSFLASLPYHIPLACAQLSDPHLFRAIFLTSFYGFLRMLNCAPSIFETECYFPSSQCTLDNQLDQNPTRLQD